MSENKKLVIPASSDSIPTSANQEDHVSMGGYSARKVLTLIDNLVSILSIELLMACQAVDIVKLKPSEWV
jgi:histidine ammonia-lyase